MLGISATCHAAGFALVEQSASGLGNAFAGGAASAEDASTIFFNPAGMTYLPDSQLVVAAHAIRPSAKFSNRGSLSGAGTPMTGGDGGDAGDWAFVPNFYFAKSLTDSIRVGVGVNAPFGLKTEYDDGWAGRYQALKSELKTVNINPSIAYRLNDKISLGAGISYQRAEATLTNAVDFGSACVLLQAAGKLPAGTCAAQALTPQGDDGFAKVKGDDWSWGYNLGALFQLSQATRVGFSYRSEIKQELSGTASFGNKPALFSAGALGAQFANGSITANATLPAIASASVFHQINDQWDVMADLTWTEWSSFRELRIMRASGTLSGATLSVQPENWDNSIRASVGASYKYDDRLKARVGFAFDESPVSNTYRTPRIPDSDRYWLAFGANYKCSPAGSLDVGYTHLFIKDNTLSQGAVGTSAGKLVGDYEGNVNILSVQYTHTF